jgi:large subunit ribosomal protein L4
MELDVFNQEGEKIRTVAVDETVFMTPFNPPLVHQLVTAYQANARLATRKQKTRAEVARSGRKPWRQKGTGRARAGSSASPIWRGGGVTFPNSPLENYHQKLNKKMYRGAMRSIFSELVRAGRLTVIDQLQISTLKTKVLAQALQKLGLENVLICLDDSTDIKRAARNLAHVDAIESVRVDPLSLLRHERVLCSETAIRILEERFRERPKTV